MSSTRQVPTKSAGISVNGDGTSDQSPSMDPENLDQSFLDTMGLVGLGDLELPILCTLVTGDPLLLVGEHGTAKTALANALSDALDLRFHAYDASKALFEDIIGFPNPDELGAGELDYVPTPLSLWDKEFVLVDEISRANAQTQSKWLEVIRSRRVMGEELSELKYVFAAMNPPEGYEGARPLDPALAGRFSFIMEVPSVDQMSGDDRHAVIETVGQDDAPLASHLFDEDELSDRSMDLNKRIQAIRDRVPDTQANHGETVSSYLSNLVEALPSRNQKRHLDGRRLGMIRRNILVGLTIRQPESDDDIAELIKTVVWGSCPHSALGEEFPDHQFELAHQHAIHGALDNHQQNGGSFIRGEDLINRALQAESPRDAISDLASLSRVFDAFTSEDSTVQVSSENVGRIINTGRQALDEVGELTKQIGSVRVMSTPTTSTRSRAVLLLGWWLVEKKQGNNFRPGNNFADKLPGLVGSLETKIKQMDEVEE